MNKNEYATDYQKRATSQNDAGKLLINEISKYKQLSDLNIVADIGCGSGGLTCELYDLINPIEMIGYDSSPEMIKMATNQNLRHNLSYCIRPAEIINEKEKFDLVFSNSSFQWFTDQKRAIRAMYNALVNKGLVAIQSSARANWCPQFLSAIAEVANHPITSLAYKHYKFPVTHYETEDDYKGLFEQAGFKIKFCKIIIQENKTDLAGAINIFKSGAAKAYLFQDYFTIEKPEEYNKVFMEILEQGLKAQCNEAQEITIEYPRAFIIAEK